MARFETRNSHAMVMTQVVLVLSPIPTTRCSKHDGVMRLKIYNLKLLSWPCTCQITQCRIQTLRFEGGGRSPPKIFSALRASIWSYVARFETGNSHAMVMTQVVRVLSPIPTTRCSKQDGVMRLEIYNLKLLSWPCTCQITQCRIQTLRFEGGGRSPPKIFSALRASIWSKNMGGPGLPGPSPGSAYYQ